MNPLMKLVEKSAGSRVLDRVGDQVSGALDKALSTLKNRQAVEDAFHGKWLGHPLHPILTDLPIGAWTFAGALDTLDLVTDRHRTSADQAIAFGVLTAVPTALAGAIDWRQTGPESRRVGVAHGLMNAGALVLFSTSLMARGKNLALGRLLSFGGLALVGVSGYFGGHLISHYRVGVKHQAEPSGTPVFSDAIAGDGLAEDTPTRMDADGMPLMVVRHGGRTYALADVCPHLGCSLSEGTIAGDAIVCPCHGSTFALEDGRVLHGPSAFPVATYSAWAVDDDATAGPILDAGME